MALTILARLIATDPREYTIGFHGWPAWVGGLQARGDRAVRLGQSGSIRQITGFESPEQEVQAWIACATEAQFKTACTDLESLPNYTHRLEMPLGIVHPHVTVNSVTITKAKRTKGPYVTGGKAVFRIEVSIRLEVQPETAADD